MPIQSLQSLHCLESITREFSPRVARASLLAGVVGVAFAFGAHWGRGDATAELMKHAMQVAALQGAHAAAVTPDEPVLVDTDGEPAPTF